MSHLILLINVVTHPVIAPATAAHTFYDIAKDFLLPPFLGIMAAVAAYYIFYRETKLGKEKEQASHDQVVLDKLTYFTALLSNIQKTAVEQNKSLKELIAEIEANDVNFPLLTYMPMQDLQRLIGLDVESYLLSFAEFYHENRKASIKKFKTIMVNSVFLHHIFKSIFEQVQKGQQFDFERKTQYQELYYRAYNTCGRFMMQLEERPELKARFLAIFDRFQANHQGDNYDLPFYFDYFFEPVNDFCTDYVTAELPITSEFEEIAITTRDGKQLFHNIKVQNQQIAKDFQGDYEKIEHSLAELKELTVRLLADF